MEIVGSGFLATQLRPLADRHGDVVVIAAGVSSTAAHSAAEFARERNLVQSVLRRCRSGRTVLFLSTASHAMYGSTPAPVAEDTPVCPVVPYGVHKRDLETMVIQSGVDWLVLRISHVVGPDQPKHQLIPALVAQLYSGEVAVHTGVHRDLLDSTDLRDSVDVLLHQRVRNEIVHVASGIAVPVESIVDGIGRRLGVRAAKRPIPGPITRTLVSTEKLRGFAPDIVARFSGPDYPERLLDRHVPAYHGAAGTAVRGAGCTNT